ncbi:hypothetical protein ACN47A_07585 [Myxococcus fulvus]|uniref:hypothetical protein n=1 Tax=Myxococcus fulvus TaxID=33 RepID=UPI003B99F5E9
MRTASSWAGSTLGARGAFRLLDDELKEENGFPLAVRPRRCGYMTRGAQVQAVSERVTNLSADGTLALRIVAAPVGRAAAVGTSKFLAAEPAGPLRADGPGR